MREERVAAYHRLKTVAHRGRRLKPGRNDYGCGCVSGGKTVRSNAATPEATGVHQTFLILPNSC
jgi:hypothetical protein